MRAFTIVIIFAVLSASGCSDRPAEEPAPASAPDPASPTADEWPEPVGGPAFAPTPNGPSMNPTEEESAAWKDPGTGGTLLVRTLDSTTGEPIAKCNYYALKHSFAPDLVDRQLGPRISRRGGEDHPDGVHTFPLGRGFYRLRLTSPTYRNTWTPIFEIRPGEEARLAIIMMPSNKIVVTILDENGEPLPRGAVLLTSNLGLRSSMVIEKGRGEGLVPVDEVVVEVGTTFLQEYVVQRVPVSLEAGGTTEVEIRLTRR